jgi:ribosomal protein L11
MIEITKENYSPQIIIKDNPFKHLLKKMLKIQEAIKNENHKIESEFDKVISEITSQKM